MRFKKLIILFFVIAIIFLTKDYIIKCLELGESNKINSIEERSYMKSIHDDNYCMEMIVTYFANDMETKYKIMHEYNNGFEKITYLEPEKFNGMVVEVNEEEIIHMNPYIQKNITYYADYPKNYNNIFFSSFVRNYLNDSKATIDETNTEYILKTTIPGDNYHFKYQECYISKETKNPLRIIIKSKDKVKVCDIMITNVKDLETKNENN